MIAGVGIQAGDLWLFHTYMCLVAVLQPDGDFKHTAPSCSGTSESFSFSVGSGNRSRSQHLLFMRTTQSNCSSSFCTLHTSSFFSSPPCDLTVVVHTVMLRGSDPNTGDLGVGVWVVGVGVGVGVWNRGRILCTPSLRDRGSSCP